MAGERLGGAGVVELVAVPSRQDEIPVVRPTNQRSYKSEGNI